MDGCSFSTLLDTAQATAPSKAIMTVLILVGVVLVVGGVAVTTVICVRRQEAKKKEEATSGGQQTAPTKLQGRQQQCFFPGRKYDGGCGWSVLLLFLSLSVSLSVWTVCLSLSFLC